MPLSKKRQRWLQTRFWFVKPNGEFVQRSITEEMERLNIDVDGASRTIPYKDQMVPGFMLGKNVAIPEWLDTNRKSLEGSDIYHADFSDGPWEKWKGNQKTPAEKNQDTPVAEQLRQLKKKKKLGRGSLGPRAATNVRMRARGK